jgi:hypothetical protein
LSLFRQGLQTNAEKIFDFDSNPALYQLALQIMKETIETLESSGLEKQNNALIGGDPTIEDAAGDPKKDFQILDMRIFFSIEMRCRDWFSA